MGKQPDRTFFACHQSVRIRLQGQLVEGSLGQFLAYSSCSGHPQAAARFAAGHPLAHRIVAVELAKKQLQVGDNLLVGRRTNQKPLVVQPAHQAVVQELADGRTCNFLVESTGGDQILLRKQRFPLKALQHDLIGAA